MTHEEDGQPLGTRKRREKENPVPIVKEESYDDVGSPSQQSIGGRARKGKGLDQKGKKGAVKGKVGRGMKEDEPVPPLKLGGSDWATGGSPPTSTAQSRAG